MTTSPDDEDDALGRLLGRVRPEVPDTAVENLLSALTRERTAQALYWGEIERLAPGALLWSAALGLLATAALGLSLHLTRGSPTRAWPLHLGMHAPTAGEIEDAQARDAPSLSLVSVRRDEQLQKDPFFLERK